MGKDLDSGNRLQDFPWQFNDLNHGSNMHQPFTEHQRSNPLVLPTYIRPFSCAFPVNAVMSVPGFQSDNSLQRMPPVNPLVSPPYRPTELEREKRHLTLDQLGNETDLLFSSSGIPVRNHESRNPGLDVQDVNEMSVPDELGDDEMHEDTEEINALLYSDSDTEYEEEEASTGHSPVKTITPSSSEVASSVIPAKRRRVDLDELDTSLMDTASSTVSEHLDILTCCSNKDSDDDATSCVKGGDYDNNVGNKRLKTARIQETVNLLRRIIPGGMGKDATTILDEAIHYLKSLKLKAKSYNDTLM